MYHAWEKYDRARELGHKALIIVYLHNVSGLNQELGKYNLALEQLEQVLTLSKDIGDKPGIALALDNIGGLNTDLNTMTKVSSIIPGDMNYSPVLMKE